MSDAPDLDAILNALNGDKQSSEGGSSMMIQMMMLQMERDRSDRAASRQTMLQMVTALAPLVLPMLLGKKEADPIMMTLLSGLLAKNNDGEQVKQMLQMMAAGNQMTMDQMKNAMLNIMEMKDHQTKKMLEDAGDRDDGGGAASGPAAIMREIRLGLGSLAPMLSAPQAEAPQAALPAPQAGAAANPGPGQQQRRPAPPVVVLLHQLAAIQSGKVKQTPATWAALATVALQDPELIAAIDDCTDDDLSPLMIYCTPHVQADKTLLAWIQAAGVGQWVDDTVRRRLMPMIDAARDDGSDDSAESDTSEPEELTPPEDDAAEGAG